MWRLITLLLAAEADKLIPSKLQLTTEYLGVLNPNPHPTPLTAPCHKLLAEILVRLIEKVSLHISV